MTRIATLAALFSLSAIPAAAQPGPSGAGRIISMDRPRSLVLGERFEVRVPAAREQALSLHWGGGPADTATTRESKERTTGASSFTQAKNAQAQTVPLVAPYQRPGRYEVRVFQDRKLIDIMPVDVVAGTVPNGVTLPKRRYQVNEPLEPTVILPPNRYYYGHWGGPSVQLVPIEIRGHKLTQEEVVRWSTSCGNRCVVTFGDVAAVAGKNPNDGGRAIKPGTYVLSDARHRLLAPRDPGRYRLLLYDRSNPSTNYADLFLAAQEIEVATDRGAAFDLSLSGRSTESNLTVVLRNEGAAEADHPRIFIYGEGMSPCTPQSPCPDTEVTKAWTGSCWEGSCGECRVESGSHQGLRGAFVSCMDALPAGDEVEIPIEVAIQLLDQPRRGACRERSTLRVIAVAETDDPKPGNNAVELPWNLPFHRVTRVSFLPADGPTDSEHQITSRMLGQSFRVVLELDAPGCGSDSIPVEFAGPDGTRRFTAYAKPFGVNRAITEPVGLLEATLGRFSEWNPLRESRMASLPSPGGYLDAWSGDARGRLGITRDPENSVVALRAFGPTGAQRPNRVVRVGEFYHAELTVPPLSELRRERKLTVMLTATSPERPSLYLVEVEDEDGDGRYQSGQRDARLGISRLEVSFPSAVVQPDLLSESWLEVRPEPTAEVRVLQPGPPEAPGTFMLDKASRIVGLGLPAILQVVDPSGVLPSELTLVLVVRRAGQEVARKTLRASRENTLRQLVPPGPGPVASTLPVGFTQEELGPIQLGDEILVGIPELDLTTPLRLVNAHKPSWKLEFEVPGPERLVPVGSEVRVVLSKPFRSRTWAILSPQQARIGLTRQGKVLAERKILLVPEGTQGRQVATFRADAERFGMEPRTGDIVWASLLPTPGENDWNRNIRGSYSAPMVGSYGTVRGIAFETREPIGWLGPLTTAKLSSAIRVVVMYTKLPADEFLNDDWMRVKLRSMRQGAAPREFSLVATLESGATHRFVTEPIDLQAEAARGTVRPGDRLEAQFHGGPWVPVTLTGGVGAVRRIRVLPTTGDAGQATAEVGLVSIPHNQDALVDVEFEAPPAAPFITVNAEVSLGSVSRKEAILLSPVAGTSRFSGRIIPSVRSLLEFAPGRTLTVRHGTAERTVRITAGDLEAGKARLSIEAESGGAEAIPVAANLVQSPYTGGSNRGSGVLDLGPGEYRVQLQYPLRAYEESVTLAAGESRSVRVTDAQLGRIVLDFRDSEGRPVTPAEVSVRALGALPHWAGAGTSKGAARYVLPAGDYDVVVRLPAELGERREEFKGVRVTAGAETAVRGAALGGARVTLLDAGGKPLAHAVTLEGPGGSHRARTGEALQLPVGAYRVRLDDPPLGAPAELALEVKSAQAGELSLRLGRIRLAQAGRESRIVSIGAGSNAGPQSLADSVDVWPGEFAISFGNSVVERRSVKVLAGQTTTVDLVGQRGRARIRLPDLTPLRIQISGRDRDIQDHDHRYEVGAGGAVTHTDVPGGPGQVVSRQAGGFEIQVAPGSYRLWAEGRTGGGGTERALIWDQVFQVPPGGTVAVEPSRMGTLEVTVCPAASVSLQARSGPVSLSTQGAVGSARFDVVEGDYRVSAGGGQAQPVSVRAGTSKRIKLGCP